MPGYEARAQVHGYLAGELGGFPFGELFACRLFAITSDLDLVSWEDVCRGLNVFLSSC
ncbi:hypothetical protein ACFY9A_40105 [Streptomyces rubradiris]|uniref:hypothetical protein n=1 Tax=Streptomyces rubradiris TaxID=285531 RepID=UPI0036EC3E4F